MDLGLDGKLFVVGGASRGLGRAVAAQLVAEGARVVLVSRDDNALSKAARELGEGAYPLAADLCDPSSVDRISGAISESGGELGGILVNSGGPPFGPALELEDKQGLAAFGSLIVGPLRLLRALVSVMGDGAAVLFVTSSSVRQPIPNLDASNVLRPGVAVRTGSNHRVVSSPAGHGSSVPLGRSRPRPCSSGRSRRLVARRSPSCASASP